MPTNVRTSPTRLWAASLPRAARRRAPRGGRCEVVAHNEGGAVPRESVPAVDTGMEAALEAGVLAGYPIVDVRAVLVDGAAHAVAPSEMAFKIAGPVALQEAARRGG